MTPASLRALEMAISVALDVFDFRRAVRELASLHGFKRAACYALELVASELGTNIVKHGIRGVARAEVFDSPERGLGMRIEARDEGPEIEDFESALLDGWSARGPLDPASSLGRHGIGAGLGAIRRLSDDFCYRREETGNHFVVVRFRR